MAGRRKEWKKCTTCHGKGKVAIKREAKVARRGKRVAKRAAKKVDGRTHRKFKCPVAGCRKKSRGPRYNNYCLEHESLSAAAKAQGLLAKPPKLTVASAAKTSKRGRKALDKLNGNGHDASTSAEGAPGTPTAQDGSAPATPPVDPAKWPGEEGSGYMKVAGDDILTSNETGAHHFLHKPSHILSNAYPSLEAAKAALAVHDAQWKRNAPPVAPPALATPPAPPEEPTEENTSPETPAPAPNGHDEYAETI